MMVQDSHVAFTNYRFVEMMNLNKVTIQILPLMEWRSHKMKVWNLSKRLRIQIYVMTLIMMWLIVGSKKKMIVLVMGQTLLVYNKFREALESKEICISSRVGSFGKSMILVGIDFEWYYHMSRSFALLVISTFSKQLCQVTFVLAIFWYLQWSFNFPAVCCA